MNEASAARPRRIVVLGTGTGVGKTWVSAKLARAFRSSGAAIIALKPVESGVSSSASAASDAALLAEASSVVPDQAPYQLADAVSPHLAARLAGKSVELDPILRYVREQESRLGPEADAAWLLVETAGALLSPLAPGVTNWDLARVLEPATWVLVAPDALGVLHDLGATLEVMRARGRLPDQIVLSAAREPDASTGTNARELALLGIAEPAACFARDRDDAAALVRRLTESARRGRLTT
jgi:dethiobiotin synthetase